METIDSMIRILSNSIYGNIGNGYLTFDFEWLLQEYLKCNTHTILTPQIFIGKPSSFKLSSIRK